MIYVNTKSRLRHADPECPHLEATRALRAQMTEAGVVMAPGRILEFSEPLAGSAADFIREFTTPCRFCWPGAHELWQNRPAGF